MKHLFIVNPTAGGSDKTAIVTERVNTAFSHFETSGDTYEIYVTKAPMDAPGKIKAEAAENERLHVYACGGDGTFNECVCGAAGLDKRAYSGFIGQVSGTGTNTCVSLPERLIGKLGSSEERGMIINMEAGLYTGIPRGSFDLMLDSATIPASRPLKSSRPVSISASSAV